MKHQFTITIETDHTIPATMCDRLADRAYGLMAMSAKQAEVTCEWHVLPKPEADPEAGVLVVIDGGRA
jgi:hypothetical protein